MRHPGEKASDGLRANGESTLVLIKPDAVSRRLTGAVLAIYEEAGLNIKGLKLMHPPLDLLQAHYAEHAGKEFLLGLLTFMQEGPVVAVLLTGSDAVAHVRRLNGTTDPMKADPGTVRNLYGSDKQRNCVHGSATVEDAQREIALWFPEKTVSQERLNP